MWQHPFQQGLKILSCFWREVEHGLREWSESPTQEHQTLGDGGNEAPFPSVLPLFSLGFKVQEARERDGVESKLSQCLTVFGYFANVI